MTEAATPHRRFKHFHSPMLQHEFASATVVVQETNRDENTGIKTWLFGWAICQPNDNFCRKTGREIAIERAEKDLFMFKTVDDGNHIDPINYALFLLDERKDKTEGEKELLLIMSVSRICQ